jgi:phosphopentomutase
MRPEKQRPRRRAQFPRLNRRVFEMRAFVLVLDSFGIGGAPDAALYGDDGADTLGHIAAACASGKADNEKRAGPLSLPNLGKLGLADAYALSTGRAPEGMSDQAGPAASYGCAAEVSRGKDTPSGHWELAGFPVLFDWGYFPRETPCFPKLLIDELCERAHLPGVLGGCHASGTAIIEELGEEHIRSGKPICYTSADSVFQIAAHEESFGLERLYEVCRIGKTLTDPLRIGRVIARPFVGDSARNFERTGNRRDFTTPPSSPTVLDHATSDGRDVISVGKIADIFGQSGTGEVLKASGNDALFDRTLEGLDGLQDGGLLFANFIDFDSIYGHRRDTAGYAFALEQFDSRVPELCERLESDDLLVITADHGCDPTWRGTDHTREQVPVLAVREGVTGSIGRRGSFADVGKTVAAHLDLPGGIAGSTF